jgi:hypothetical protein
MSLGAPKYRYELLLPLYDNEGHPIDPLEITRVREQLGAKFGGYRFQPTAPYHGSWEDAGVTYEDVALLFTVDGPREEADLYWFHDYKEELKKAFRQVEIYLAVSEIIWL